MHAKWISPDPAMLTELDFIKLRDLIALKTGICMGNSKKDLLQARLRSRLKDLALERFRDYSDYLQSLPDSHGEWQQFINSLTTNKTDFYREPQHFQFLQNTYLPLWQEGAGQQLKVWCAAASTGEEPYTISMCLRRGIVLPKSYQILATDIDTEVLEVARKGIYRKDSISSLPEDFRSSAFMQGTGEIAQWVRVKDYLKKTITFETHNLIDKKNPPGAFDLIFCRNVLIYFAKETIEQVVQKLYQAAKPGGLLFIGHSESLQSVRTDWKYRRPSVYQKS